MRFRMLLREVVGEYTLEDVLPYVGEEQRKYKQYFVRMNSTKLRLFAENIHCVRCGVTGLFFQLERHKNDPPNKAHLNLYAIALDGTYVLMTQDHIIPKSKGGSDKIENLQTMCRYCNEAKGNNPEGSW